MMIGVGLTEVTMGTTRKTITVTTQQDEWIKAQVGEGRFTNDSEYIRDLIRHDQARESEIEAVRGALIEGERSGKPRRVDVAAFKRRMAAEHAKKAR
jgi:antitoxin ParD1/3/4